MRSRLLLLATLLLIPACSAGGGDASTTPAGSSTTPGGKPAVQATAARELYDRALAEAKNVAPDVTLVRINTRRGVDFNAHLPADGKVPHWVFTFSSKSQNVQVNINASALEVKKVLQTPDPFDEAAVIPEGWVDSPAAFTAAQGSGGSDYLAANGNIPVAFELSLDRKSGKHLWTVTYSSNPRKGLFRLTVDALSGTFVDKFETQATAPTSPPAAPKSPVPAAPKSAPPAAPSAAASAAPPSAE